MKNKLTKYNCSRFKLLSSMIFIALCYFAVTRLALLLISFEQSNASLAQLLQLNLIGLVYDIAFLAYASIPFTLYLLLLPNKWWNGRFNRIVTHVITFSVLYGMGFVVVAEWLFWDEFSVRFNFIAVDYLVYRREVTNNIVESYPLFTLLLGIFLATCVIYYFILKSTVNKALSHAEPLMKRLVLGGVLFIVSVIFYVFLNQDMRSFSDNNYQNELASNGPYQFFAAFRSNELDYNTFYKTLPDKQMSAVLKEEIIEVNAKFSEPNRPYSIMRSVSHEGIEKPLNVVLIMVESLSAKYLGSFGNKEKLTPYLDQLAKESLFFDNFYATGTRTTRGLEAVTLSIPPTPGRSIVKRIGKEKNMWSLGQVLKTKNYDTKFMYGGDGYFDNMNEFFSGNGYEIFDKSSIPTDQVIFSNAWGVSDEDLFNATLNEANKSFNRGKPFFFHLMTTSNHRPYSYPGGRIDIPSKTGREGAVKYTDWAIGDFIKKAKKTSWFKDTIFVIVADHCAGSAGKTALPVNKYHIPLFIYAPSHLSPKTISKLSSQIDVGPTLLGLMNMNYKSYAFGKDIMLMNKGDGRALIANYQHLGLYQKGKLSILSPKRLMTSEINPESEIPSIKQLQEPDDQMRKNIAFYQGASHIYSNKMNHWNNQDKNIAN